MSRSQNLSQKMDDIVKKLPFRQMVSISRHRTSISTALWRISTVSQTSFEKSIQWPRKFSQKWNRFCWKDEFLCGQWQRVGQNKRTQEICWKLKMAKEKWIFLCRILDRNNWDFWERSKRNLGGERKDLRAWTYEGFKKKIICFWSYLENPWIKWRECEFVPKNKGLKFKKRRERECWLVCLGLV